MFSLIITVISIALVATLALATIYYGGSFAKDGQARAQSTKYLQEGTQLVGALELYKTEHNGIMPEGTNEEVKALLVDKEYLKKWPASSWEYSQDFAIRADVEEATCRAINKSLKIDVIPACSDPAYSAVKVCCNSDTAS